ncbi:MAG: hypothetical protein ACOYN0_16870 [Phycisphaerales bacterium]
MPKLPSSMKTKLANSLSKGSLPELDEPGYNDFFDVFGKFAATLWEDATNPHASQVRRHVAALVTLWSAIPADGVLTGVACNQPEVVPVAIEAAEALRLPNVAEGLRAIADCIPQEVAALPSPSDRLECYNSPRGQESADRLESLYDILTEDEAFGTALMIGTMQQTLAAPSEFFEG